MQQKKGDKYTPKLLQIDSYLISIQKNPQRQVYQSRSKTINFQRK